MNRVLSWTVAALLILLAGLVPPSSHASEEDFFKGKTIRFIVGYSPGGGYDAYTRMVARNISKYIPGNPTVVVQNMTGAGSLIAANYNFYKAKPDGLTVGVWNSAFVFRQAMDDPAIKFDVREFEWLGTPAKATPTCVIMASSGYKTLDDVMNAEEPIKMGGTRAGSFLDDLPKILNKTMGTNFEVISGYRGTANIRLAMQTGEIDGACWQWESIRSTARSMLDAEGDKELIPFVIHSRWDDPEVKDLPLIPEVIEDEKSRQMYQAAVAKSEIHTPFALPPGTPPERVAILREAFKAALHDPELLAESKKTNLPVQYVPPEEVEETVDEILDMPPDVKENLGFLMRRTN